MEVYAKFDPGFRESLMLSYLNSKREPYQEVDAKRYLDHPGFNCQTATMILTSLSDRINDFSSVKLNGFIDYVVDEELSWKMNCYEIGNGLIFSDWWIIDGSGYVYTNFDYIVRDDEMYIQYNWDRTPRYSYTRQMIEKYYLKRYKYVISELNPIRRAFKCWIQIIRGCRSSHNIDLMHYNGDWNGPTIISINPII